MQTMISQAVVFVLFGLLLFLPRNFLLKTDHHYVVKRLVLPCSLIDHLVNLGLDSLICFGKQRMSMAIIRVCDREVLFISVYGFANRYREGKRPNDLLLASLIPVISEVGLPYCILGDFNEPPAKLPSFQFFRDQGAWEAFSWFQAKFDTVLPATCAGSTRNDTAILHPWLLQFVHDMSVSQDVTFEPHSPFLIDFNFNEQQHNRLTWNLPKSWAPFAPHSDFIAESYVPLDFDAIHTQFNSDNHKLVDESLAQWSRAWIKPWLDRMHWILFAIRSQICILPSREDVLSRNLLRNRANIASDQIIMVGIPPRVKFFV